MASKNKTRDAASVIQQLKTSPLFSILLDQTSSNIDHFARTLGENPKPFLDMYNVDGKVVHVRTQNQVDLGMTNDLKLGFYVLTKLVSEQFNDPAINHESVVEFMTTYQLPGMKEAGLRFKDVDRLTAMAAVWYSYVTSPRKDNPWEELAESFYDIFWLFLEPIEEARAINFDRATFKHDLENTFMKKNPAVSAKANKQQQVEVGLVVTNKWFKLRQAMAEAGVGMDPEMSLSEYLEHADAKFAMIQRSDSFVEFTKRLYGGKKSIKVDTRFFKEGASQWHLMASTALLTFFTGLHDQYLGDEGFIQNLIGRVATAFEDNGYAFNDTVAPMGNDDAQLVGLYNVWSRKNGTLAHVNNPIQTRAEMHLAIGTELLIIAELVTSTISMYYNAANAQPVPLSNIVIETLSYLMKQADGIVIAHEIKVGNIKNPTDALPANSIFNIGAEAFYRNLTSIITKEKEMTAKTNAAIAAQQAAEATPASMEMQLMEQQLNQALTENEKRWEELEASRVKDREELEKNLAAINKRLGDLEIVTAKNANLEEKTPEGKEALERIKVASQEAVKAVQDKAPKRKTDWYDVSHLTTTEKVAAGVGTVAVAGALVYGAMMAHDYFFNDDNM